MFQFNTAFWSKPAGGMDASPGIAGFTLSSLPCRQSKGWRDVFSDWMKNCCPTRYRFAYPIRHPSGWRFMNAFVMGGMLVLSGAGTVGAAGGA